MKLQPLFPYNSTILGLDDQYITYGNDSFYINSKNIQACQCTITTGRTYVLILNLPDTDLQLLYVELVDVYYDNVLLNIIVKDLKTRFNFNIAHDIRNNRNDNRWVLIDWDYMRTEITKAEIMSFCGCL